MEGSGRAAAGLTSSAVDNAALQWSMIVQQLALW